MISQILTWWSDGLAAAWFAAERILRRPRRFQLRAAARPFALWSAKASARQPIVSFEFDDDQRMVKLPAEILQQTRRSLIEIVVPSAAILERQLDPLPGESRPYVENVVRHQIETLFPWRTADILFSTEVRDRPDGRIDVIVHATARAAIAPALAAATACGADEVVVIREGEDGNGRRPAAIPVLSGPEGQARLNRARLISRCAIFALTTLTFCVISWTTFARWSLASDVAALDQAIADRHAILERASDLRGAGAAGGLETKKQQTPIAVVVLEELSAVLPDDTYVSDLALDAGRLRVAGVSAHAAELVALLEASGHFRNAVFYAPTTRMPDGLTDRFSIETALAPQAQATP
jgi:general secretion pathway protein L